MVWFLGPVYRRDGFGFGIFPGVVTLYAYVGTYKLIYIDSLARVGSRGPPKTHVSAVQKPIPSLAS
jgi:hypothetical protein